MGEVEDDEAEDWRSPPQIVPHTSKPLTAPKHVHAASDAFSPSSALAELNSSRAALEQPKSIFKS